MRFFKLSPFSSQFSKFLRENSLSFKIYEILKQNFLSLLDLWAFLNDSLSLLNFNIFWNKTLSPELGHFCPKYQNLGDRNWHLWCPKRFLRLLSKAQHRPRIMDVTLKTRFYQFWVNSEIISSFCFLEGKKDKIPILEMKFPNLSACQMSVIYMLRFHENSSNHPKDFTSLLGGLKTQTCLLDV